MTICYDCGQEFRWVYRDGALSFSVIAYNGYRFGHHGAIIWNERLPPRDFVPGPSGYSWIYRGGGGGC